MHRLTSLAVALLVAAAGACSDGEPGGAAQLPEPPPTDVEFAAAPDTAPPAPEFSGELVDGTAVESTELWADRPLVLMFTASWCGRCADIHREVASAVEEHEGVALLGLVDVGDEGAGEYAAELGIDQPLAVVETEVWDAYAVEEPPLVALVAPGGALLRGWPGGVEQAALEEQLAELYADRGAEG